MTYKIIIILMSILTPHYLGPVLQTIQIAPIQPDNVALGKVQTAQTCWLSSGPEHVWRTQSSVGKKIIIFMKLELSEITK